MTVGNYRDLSVWRRSLDMVDTVYRIIARFPSDERFGLTSQLRRASISIPANIAEGCASGYTRMYLKHLAVARGSLAEIETYLEIACRLGYVNQTTVDTLTTESDQVGRMLVGLQHAIRRRLPKP